MKSGTDEMVPAVIVLSILATCAALGSVVIEVQRGESVIPVLLCKPLPLLIGLSFMIYAGLARAIGLHSLFSQVGVLLVVLGSVGILTSAALEIGGLRENHWVVLATRVFPWVMGTGIFVFSLAFLRGHQG